MVQSSMSTSLLRSQKQIGSYHLHANMVHFQREPKQKTSSYNNDLHSGNDRLPNVTYSGNIREHDFSNSLMGQVKEVAAIPYLYTIHPEKGFQSSKITYLGGLGHKAKKRWIKELCLMHKINFFAIQETKMESIDLFSIKMLWGNLTFDHAVSSSVGNSGGILCVWDSNKFIKKHVSSSDYFLAIMGTWTPTSTKLLVISVYAPKVLSEKRELWGYLCSLIDRWDGETVVLGDFNEVQIEQERFSSTFNIQGANAFNNFISLAGLVDLPLGGYSYTWAHKSASKMSKLVRFLISEGDDEIRIQRASLLKDLNDITSNEALDLSQKAKIRWSIEGDENSKYFHGILNSKRSQLAILEQVEELENFISYDEIKIAVWEYGINKSPGPDRFTFEFFQKYWKIMGQDIVAAVTEFVSTGKFPPGCNSTFIALIPKIHDAKIIKDFRPISLIGSIYKIIAKILANRLILVIPDLINEVQTAFFPNRQILDGPFILNELISWCKHKKVNAMIFKVDFEKAFDSVRWDYLDDILKSFGFGDTWRSWISGCLNSAKGSVLINGSPTSEFQFHKGLKQGDLLSPFLFILVMESLHRSFSRLMEASLFKGISINNSLSISHLFYADDAVFVSEWNISNIKTIVNVLNYFFMALGLKINLHKSTLSGIGISKAETDLATSIVGCSIFSLPFHYLGVKLEHLCLESFRRRKSLTKSLLDSLLLYYMSIYKAPTAVLKDLESIHKVFFPGDDKVDRKMVWFRWEKFLELKKNIRLGVSSLYATNRALLFKWIWRFLTQCYSLWSSLIKAFHEVKINFDDSQTKISGSIWQELVREFAALKSKGIDCVSFIKQKLGNGENTLFWEDIWLGDSALKMTHPRLFALELKKDITVAEKMGNASLNLSFRRLPRSGIEDEQYKNLVSITSDVLLPQMHDRWSWSLNASGDFTVRSVRNHMDDVLLPKSDVPTRWVTMIPIKINILAWKISMDRLPTRFNHSSRGLEIQSILCPLCNVAVETTSHIFFSCSLSRHIMHKVCRWWELDISSFNSYVEWFNWLSNARIAKRKKEILEGILVGELVVGELLVGELVVGDLVGELVVGDLMVGELMTGLLFLFILAVKASGRV
ncbi:RNA-directed DNA polymerase, eukaryota [Tanacetum coccineum]